MDDSDASDPPGRRLYAVGLLGSGKGPIVGESGRAASYVRREVPQTTPDFIELPKGHKLVNDTASRPPAPGARRHREAARHAVECGINRLKRYRAMATRYEKLALRYEATVLVASINEWL